jgi:hypothetical protein
LAGRNELGHDALAVGDQVVSPDAASRTFSLRRFFRIFSPTALIA